MQINKSIDLKKWALAILLISALLSVGIFLWLQSHNELQLAPNTEEITLNEVPEKIREEMNENLENPGAHYYKTSDSDEVYALLTTGTVLGLSMDITPYLEEGDITYFAIDLKENGNSNEELLYKVFKTKSKNVAADVCLCVSVSL